MQRKTSIIRCSGAVYRGLDKFLEKQMNWDIIDYAFEIHGMTYDSPIYMSQDSTDAYLKSVDLRTWIEWFNKGRYEKSSPAHDCQSTLYNAFEDILLIPAWKQRPDEKKSYENYLLIKIGGSKRLNPITVLNHIMVNYS